MEQIFGLLVKSCWKDKILISISIDFKTGSFKFFFHYSDYFLDIRIDSDYFEYVPLFTGLDGPAYQSIRLLTPYYCLNQSYDDVPKPLSDTQFTDYLVILSPLMTKAPYAVT